MVHATLWALIIVVVWWGDGQAHLLLWWWCHALVAMDGVVVLRGAHLLLKG